MISNSEKRKRKNSVIVQIDSPSQFSCKVSVVQSHDKGLILFKTLFLVS